MSDKTVETSAGLVHLYLMRHSTLELLLEYDVGDDIKDLFLDHATYLENFPTEQQVQSAARNGRHVASKTAWLSSSTGKRLAWKTQAMRLFNKELDSAFRAAFKECQNTTWAIFSQKNDAFVTMKAELDAAFGKGATPSSILANPNADSLDVAEVLSTRTASADNAQNADALQQMKLETKAITERGRLHSMWQSKIGDTAAELTSKLAAEPMLKQFTFGMCWT